MSLWGRRYPCPQEGCSAAISALDTTMTPGRWEELRAGAYGAAVNPPSMQAAALGVRDDTLEELSRFYGCGGETSLAGPQVFLQSLP